MEDRASDLNEARKQATEMMMRTGRDIEIYDNNVYAIKGEHTAEMLSRKHRVLETIEAIPDDNNPNFALCGLSNAILGMAARGEIDLNDLANKELAKRGHDMTGTWVGFEKAKAEYKRLHGARTTGSAAFLSAMREKEAN